MAGDASWGSVVALLHCNGANNATAFPDTSLSARVFTANGDAKLATAQSKFGTASIVFDGSGDYISSPSSSDFNLSVNSVQTYECFIRFASLAGNPYIFNLPGDVTNNRVAIQYNSGTDKIDVFRAIAATPVTVSSSVVGAAINTWHHVAWVINGGTTKVFFDGVQVYTGSLSYPSVSSALDMGSALPVANSNHLNGFIDEVRVTKGVARYSANFTPPVAAFADGMGQVLGTVRDASGAACSRTVRGYRRDTGALAGSAVSDGTTGAYSFYVPTLDELTVMALDSATSGTYYNDQVARVIPA